MTASGRVRKPNDSRAEVRFRRKPEARDVATELPLSAESGQSPRGSGSAEFDPEPTFVGDASLYRTCPQQTAITDPADKPGRRKAAIGVWLPAHSLRSNFVAARLDEEKIAFHIPVEPGEGGFDEIHGHLEHSSKQLAADALEVYLNVAAGASGCRRGCENRRSLARCVSAHRRRNLGVERSRRRAALQRTWISLSRLFSIDEEAAVVYR